MPQTWTRFCAAGRLDVAAGGERPGRDLSDPVGRAYYNSPGSDTGNDSSLNAEYVTIKNTSSTTRSLTGYTVRDVAGHTYTFGTFSLGAGNSVRIHTGKRAPIPRPTGSGAAPGMCGTTVETPPTCATQLALSATVVLGPTAHAR